MKKYTKIQFIAKTEYNSRILLELRRFNKQYIMHAKVIADIGCVTNKSSIMIKLKKKIKIMNFWDVDCGDETSIFFKLSKENYNFLLKSQIENFRVTCAKYYADFNEVDKPNFFIDYLQCIK